MDKSPIPLLILGGAALLLVSGKKSRSAKVAKLAPSAPPATIDKDPIPEKHPPAAVSSGLSDSDKNKLLIDLGYQGLNHDSIMAFQKNWNDMMVWLWKNNPNIDKNTPKYGLIGVDGKWGKITESRAMRAIDHIPRDGAVVEIDDEIFNVSSFRDMVQKVISFIPSSKPNQQDGQKINLLCKDDGEVVRSIIKKVPDDLDEQVRLLSLSKNEDCRTLSIPDLISILRKYGSKAEPSQDEKDYHISNEFPFHWSLMNDKKSGNVNIQFPDKYLENNLAPFLSQKAKHNELITGSSLTGNKITDEYIIEPMMDSSLDEALSEFISNYGIKIHIKEYGKIYVLNNNINISEIPNISDGLWYEFLSLMKYRGREFQMGNWPSGPYFDIKYLYEQGILKH